MIVPESLLDLHRVQHAELLGDGAVRRARAAAGRATIGSLGSIEPGGLRTAFASAVQTTRDRAAAAVTAVSGVAHDALAGARHGEEPDCCPA